MFLFWLAQLLRVPVLQPTDTLYCMLDKPSFDSLLRNSSLPKLMRDSSFPIKWILTRPPRNAQEGFLQRYKIPLTYTQDILLYSDIDILFLRSIESLVATMVPNRLYLHAEGLLKDSPYYNHSFSKERLAIYPEKSAGFSSGKFAIYGKELARYFLSAVRVQAYQSPTYMEETTGDQPYFNLAVYTYLIDIPTPYRTDLTHFTRKTIATNGHGLSADSYCIDCMGEESGNGGIHWKKVLYFYTLLLSGKALV